MSAPSFRWTYAQARAGDPDAFHHLVDLYRGPLEQFVRRRSGNDVQRRVEPDDVVQEAMLAFYLRLNTFPEDLDEDELRGYALQIARWKIADTVADRPPTAALIERDTATPVSSTGTVTRADDQRRLRTVLESLPPRDAEVIDLCLIKGRATAQVANSLGLTPEAIRQRLRRARVRLREAWMSEDPSDA